MKTRARITIVQRNAMLNFIMAHPSLSTGKFLSGEGDRLKAQLADVLNNIEGGAVKSPEKWFRSWQDWKSDVKKKATAIQKLALAPRAVGGPSSPDLSPLEESLISFIRGESKVSLELSDPLEVSTASAAGDIEMLISEESLPTSEEHSETSKKSTSNGRMLSALEVQTAAMQAGAAAMDQHTAAMRAGAAAMHAGVAAMNQHTVAMRAGISAMQAGEAAMSHNMATMQAQAVSMSNIALQLGTLRDVAKSLGGLADSINNLLGGNLGPR